MVVQAPSFSAVASSAAVEHSTAAVEVVHEIVLPDSTAVLDPEVRGPGFGVDLEVDLAAEQEVEEPPEFVVEL